MTTNANPAPVVLSTNCTGPNPTCRKEHRAGRHVHVIPAAPSLDAGTRPVLVMPTYHYRTAEGGLAAIAKAMISAPTVATDDDLYHYRLEGMPHFLPVGWVDPTRR